MRVRTRVVVQNIFQKGTHLERILTALEAEPKNAWRPSTRTSTWTQGRGTQAQETATRTYIKQNRNREKEGVDLLAEKGCPHFLHGGQWQILSRSRKFVTLPLSLLLPTRPVSLVGSSDLVKQREHLRRGLVHRGHHRPPVPGESQLPCKKHHLRCRGRIQALQCWRYTGGQANKDISAMAVNQGWSGGQKGRCTTHTHTHPQKL